FPDADRWLGLPMPNIDQIRTNASSNERVGRLIDPTGETWLFGYTSFGPVDAGAITVVSIPESTALATSRRLANNTAVAAAFAILLVRTAGWFGSGAFVLRWVDRLTGTVRRFAAGDMAARALIPSSAGELHELAGAFNDLSDRLAARERELRTTNAALRDGEA